jgi:hypothetical protein
METDFVARAYVWHRAYDSAWIASALEKVEPWQEPHIEYDIRELVVIIKNLSSTDHSQHSKHSVVTIEPTE